jgi:hypothetical protein
MVVMQILVHVTNLIITNSHLDVIDPFVGYEKILGLYHCFFPRELPNTIPVFMRLVCSKVDTRP